MKAAERETVIDDYRKAYEYANGETPRLEYTRGFLWVNGNRHHLRFVSDMIKRLRERGDAAATEAQPA